MIIQYGQVVVPIYIERKIGKLEHEGSGVLIQTREDYWMFTAPHVLAQHTTGRVLVPGIPFFNPSGRVRSTCLLVPEIAAKSLNELSFVKLTKQEADWVTEGGGRFLAAHPDALDPAGHTPFPGKGSISGYPTMSVEIDQTEAIVHPTDLGEMQFASPDRIFKAGRNPKTTIGLVRDPAMELQGVPLHDVDFHGLSGGAIWTRIEANRGLWESSPTI